ncbi:MAG: hypothetical protein H6766_06985 [Candidatus Peribacteria bacterium]|nr:MAG: hypothetical protein H6766_06985 [Candidatus Peribacteria bacterium]
MLLSYPELMSQGYRSDLEKILQSSGRRTLDDVDSHAQKLFLLDQSVQGMSDIPGIMTRANTLLESALVQKVDDNDYAVPYPLFV